MPAFAGMTVGGNGVKFFTSPQAGKIPAFQPARRPQCLAPVEIERAEGIRLGQPLDGRARHAVDRLESLDRAKAIAAMLDQLVDLGFAQAADLPKAKADGMPAGHTWPRLERAIPVAEIDIDGANLNAMLARIAHELRRLV